MQRLQNPWLVAAVEHMATAQRRMTVTQLCEAIGNPKGGIYASSLLQRGELTGYVHSIGTHKQRRYTVGPVPLPVRRPVVVAQPTSLIGRNAPRVPSVWAWAQVVQERETA